MSELPNCVKELNERRRSLLGIALDVPATVLELVPERQPVFFDQSLKLKSLVINHFLAVINTFLKNVYNTLRRYLEHFLLQEITEIVACIKLKKLWLLIGVTFDSPDS